MEQGALRLGFPGAQFIYVVYEFGYWIPGFTGLETSVYNAHEVCWKALCKQFSDLAGLNKNFLQIVLWFRIFLYFCIPLRRKGNSEKDKK
jgi:hypothetical protein